MKKLWIKTLAMALAAVLCLAACPLTAAPATAEGEVHKLRLMGISPDNDYFKFDETRRIPGLEAVGRRPQGTGHRTDL